MRCGVAGDRGVGRASRRRVGRAARGGRAAARGGPAVRRAARAAAQLGAGAARQAAARRPGHAPRSLPSPLRYVSVVTTRTITTRNRPEGERADVALDGKRSPPPSDDRHAGGM